jgi:DNA-binding PadR family transcriptional regulator
MNTLDKEIMMVLLGPQPSMYGVEKSLGGTNYATVYRHIKKMQKNGLLSTTEVARKNGKQDMRGTKKPELTTKGLATLIVDGDLEKKELIIAGKKVLQTEYSDLSEDFVQDTNVNEIFANTLLKMRHKINLKYFDEDYFNEVFNISFAETLFDELKKHDFQKETKHRAKAKKLKKKYVTSKQVEGLRNLRTQFINERNRLDHYVKFIGVFLKNFDKSEVE